MDAYFVAVCNEVVLGEERVSFNLVNSLECVSDLWLILILVLGWVGGAYGDDACCGNQAFDVLDGEVGYADCFNLVEWVYAWVIQAWAYLSGFF
jgi:hypothetical protein